MEQLNIFESEEFGQVRIIEINNKPYFVASDIAKSLGYRNTQDAILRHCRWVVKHDVPHPQSKDKTIEVNVIPEGDIYRLVSHSELPSAEKFESWVFDEVLPSIRKHGMYATDELVNNPDLLIAVATQLKEERKARVQAEQKVIEMKPLATFGEALSKSETSILIRELAKIITQSTNVSIGEKRLYSWLRVNKYIMQDSTEPYQNRVEQGLFERKANGTYTNCDGVSKTSYTTYVTPKGQQHFINKFNLMN